MPQQRSVTSWASIGLVWRFDERGCLQVLLIPNVQPRRGNMRQKKLVGGKKHVADKNPVETMYRELYEETHCKDSQESMERVTHENHDDENPDGGIHQKVFFLIRYDDLTGEKMRDDKVDDDGKILEPPEWVTLKEIEAELYRGHLKAFIKCLGVLANRYEEVGFKASDILSRHSDKLEL